MVGSKSGSTVFSATIGHSGATRNIRRCVLTTHHPARAGCGHIVAEIEMLAGIRRLNMPARQHESTAPHIGSTP